MSTETLNFQLNINKKFDDYSISQIIIKYAAPHKKELQKHNIRELEELLNEVISNRGCFEGNSRQPGEHALLIKKFLSTDQEIMDLYPTRHHFDTHLEKVITLIDYIGHDQFTTKALTERFNDNATATTVRNMYLQAIEKAKNKDKPLKKNRKGVQQEFAGTIEKMTETPIDVDFLVHKNYKNKQLPHPWGFLIKYGKSGRSVAKKIGEYVADEVKAIHNKAKVNDVNIYNYDPGIALSYTILKGKEIGKKVLKEPSVRKAFGLNDSNKKEAKKTRKQLEQLITYEEIKKKAKKENRKIPEKHKIPMDKTTNRYVRNILERGAQYAKTLDEQHKDNLMLRFYLEAGQLEDIRGISVIKQHGIIGAPHFETMKYFKPGSGEKHNEETNKGRRKYHSEHGKFYTRILEKIDKKRWNEIKSKRLIEVQKEDISGLILNLLGPDNRTKYGDTKKHTKYDFSDEQDRLRTKMESRISWLTEPLDEAIGMLLETIHKNPTQQTYQEELTTCAEFLHKRLYPELYKK